MKTQSSELLEEKIELKATLDFVTNRNGELNEKLLESTKKTGENRPGPTISLLINH